MKMKMDKYIKIMNYKLGSGSTYIYGYCDSNFKENMTQTECVEFVKNCKFNNNNDDD